MWKPDWGSDVSLPHGGYTHEAPPNHGKLNTWNISTYIPVVTPWSSLSHEDKYMKF